MELEDAVKRAKDGHSVYVPYRVRDESCYDEIGKTLCIHMTYNVSEDQFRLQIWNPKGAYAPFGKTFEERLSQWSSESEMMIKFRKRFPFIVVSKDKSIVHLKPHEKAIVRANNCIIYGTVAEVSGNDNRIFGILMNDHGKGNTLLKGSKVR